MGALRAGVSVAAGCPGIPSTEILETVEKEIGSGVPGSKGSSGSSGSSFYQPPTAPGSQVYVEWSVNEKAAMELAGGAAISGARALVVMNQAGLNVASDPLITLNYLGVVGGLVVVAADDLQTDPSDPGSFSSWTEQDSRHFGRFSKLPVFDPSSVEEAYLMVADAFNFSEKYGHPVIFRPTLGICYSFTSLNLDIMSARPIKQPGFDKSRNCWINVPAITLKNHEKIEADLVKIGEDFSSYKANSLVLTPNINEKAGDDSLPVASGRLGIATGGASYAYVMENLNPMPPGIMILKVGTLPIPNDLALKFLEGLDEVLVIEELDSIIEDDLLRLCGIKHLRVDIRGKRTGDIPRSGKFTPMLVGKRIEAFVKKVWIYLSDLEKEKIPEAGKDSLVEFSNIESVPPAVFAAVANAADAQIKPLPEAPPLPVRSPVHCAGCHQRGGLLAVREAAKKFGQGRKTIFSGDIGCNILGYTEPLEIIDTCLCTGAGINMAQGIGRAEQGVINITFIRDSTFFHTGIPALISAVHSSSDIIIVLFDNRTARKTENQPCLGPCNYPVGNEGEMINISALAAVLGVKDIFKANSSDSASVGIAIEKALGKSGVRLVILESPAVINKGNGSPGSFGEALS